MVIEDADTDSDSEESTLFIYWLLSSAPKSANQKRHVYFTVFNIRDETKVKAKTLN